MKKILKKLFSYKFIRYSIGGGLAAFLDLILLYIFTDYFKIYYLLSAIISFLIAVTFGYFFQKYITFRNKSKKHLLQGGLFLAFQLVGQGIYMGVLRLGVDILGFYYMIVAIIGKGIAFIWNYLSNHYFNFKH